MQTTLGMVGVGMELVMSLRFDELVGDAQPVSKRVAPAMKRDAVLLNINLTIQPPQHS